MSHPVSYTLRVVCPPTRFNMRLNLNNSPWKWWQQDSPKRRGKNCASMLCNNPKGYNSAFEHHQPIMPENLYDTCVMCSKIFSVEGGQSCVRQSYTKTNIEIVLWCCSRHNQVLRWSLRSTANFFFGVGGGEANANHSALTFTA